MAFCHAELLAQLLDAVERHIILADGRHGLGHKRRQGTGGLVGLGCGAEQRVGHGGRLRAAQLCDQLRRAGAGSAVRPARRPQLQQVGVRAVAGQPHGQQMAVALRRQHQGGRAQQNIAALARAVNAVQQARPAGKHPHPQAVSGQSQRRCAVQFRRFGSGAVNFRVKYQFRHLYINKMLFSNRL